MRIEMIASINFALKELLFKGKRKRTLTAVIGQIQLEKTTFISLLLKQQ